MNASEAKIYDVLFNRDAIKEIEQLPDNIGKNWPVVYIINNNDEAYIGETVNAYNRAKQHYDNPDRRKLKNMHIISQADFNKSAILDLESYLIEYMSSDGQYLLQNGNHGMQMHDYFNRLRYEENFAHIWRQLHNKGLVIHDVNFIKNSDLFKYSPYKALSFDQYAVANSLIECLAESRKNNKKTTMIVQGCAGTGKTVLAVYLTKLLSESYKEIISVDGTGESEFNIGRLAYNLSSIGQIKVGLVVPMQSLRKTIKEVFGHVKGLKKNMVLKPVEATKEHYDLLIVDEAHRLRQRKGLSGFQYNSIDETNERLGLDASGNELDWILKCSDNQVFFYDSTQSVKPADVDKNQFEKMLKDKNVKKFPLTSQFRCNGGNDYIDYVHALLSDNPPQSRTEQFGNPHERYDFKLFDDVQVMIDAIKAKNKEFGLCRTVAGYSWEWKTKKKKALFDIEIDGHRYKWNSTDKDWVNSENAINEIGCIHTIQGYDLNYAGVILGNEIKYDIKLQKIVFDMSKYQDLPGKWKMDDETLKTYIPNIYATMMTRGIKGTYVYACDEGMREYLKKYIAIGQ